MNMTMPVTTEKTQTEIQMRLRRIEGQVRGIIGMLDEGKPCEDVVMQIMAARAGMDRVAEEVVKCFVTDALGDQASSNAREAVLRAVTLLSKL
jgi:CsoR family transcriptional regulator, copper-sensing transcriptional repressor